MSAKKFAAPSVETFEDELDAHIAESLQDAEYRAAGMDVDRRLRLIESLVNLRKKVGLTQAQVARRMGVGQSTVSGFETEGSDPRLSTVQRFARAVEAECHIVVQVAQKCDWIAPAHIYMESVESAGQVRVDFTYPSDLAVEWSKRCDFALAG